jgi:hypothetical protein
MCFEFNSPNRILRCRFWGRVSDEELLYFYRMATLISESLDPLSGISDFSAVTSFECTPEMIRTLAAFPPIISQPSRPRVIVATDEDTFGLARVFGIEGEATRPNLHVVRSVDAEWVILGVERPQFESIAAALDSK